jgi:hypothetical protein
VLLETGLDVPQLPGRAVHQSLGEERRNVVIVRVGTVDLAHAFDVLLLVVGDRTQGDEVGYPDIDMHGRMGP